MSTLRTALRRLIPKRLRAQAFLKLRWMKAVLRGDRRAGLYFRHWMQELGADLRDLFGAKRVECPVCGWRGNVFHPYVSGHSITPGANCPICESKPRHRVLYIFLEQELTRMPAVDGGRRLLDFAPVPSFSRALGRLPGVRYLSADLMSPQAMLHSDLRCFGVRTGSIHILICYHVLEHIIEDREAMRELGRILAPGGVGLIQVPIDAKLEETEEWGKPDWELHGHVRQYARDFYDRLRSEGFTVEVIDAPTFVPQAVVERYGLILESFCRVQVGEVAVSASASHHPS